MVIFPLDNLLPVADINVSLVNFGVQEKDKEHLHGPILKSEYVLQYITDGQGYLETRGKTYPLKKGDMFCLQKDVMVKYYAHPENPYTYFWAGLDGVSIKKTLALMGFSDYSPVINYSDDGIVNIFQEINSALNQKNFAGYIRSQGKVYELISYLLAKRKENLEVLKNTGMQYVSKAIEYIKDNYNNDITVTEIAKKVDLCRNYLSVIFKKHVGVSPVEFLMQYRISQAQIMLKQKTSVTDTAMLCGFNSVSNFSVQFKRLVGKTPYEYKTKRE